MLRRSCLALSDITTHTYASRKSALFLHWAPKQCIPSSILEGAIRIDCTLLCQLVFFVLYFDIYHKGAYNVRHKSFIEDDIAAAPFLPPQMQKITLKKIPNLTFKQVKDRQLDDSNLNYLEKAMLYGCIKEATATREKHMKQEATLLRERLFHKTTSRQKWPKNLIPGSAVEIRNKENQTATQYIYQTTTDI